APRPPHDRRAPRRAAPRALGRGCAGRQGAAADQAGAAHRAGNVGLPRPYPRGDRQVSPDASGDGEGTRAARSRARTRDAVVAPWRACVGGGSSVNAAAGSRERMLELLCDRALEGLEAHEANELAQLVALHRGGLEDESYDLAAAALALDVHDLAAHAL